ncbi:unnamed protein product [Mytilus coruscus]|uniref:Uncharacterized protein n=1 Tax=Mytilus coruscus TaxID=42192 RepID=A0A6J8C2C5_MYTCO|nr:unnamed protein product [Mytilus coruscus]
MKLNCREQLQDRIFYYKKFFCCDNYEDHNGRCERGHNKHTTSLYSTVEEPEPQRHFECYQHIHSTRSSPNNEIEDNANAYAEIDEERMCPDSSSSRTDQSNGDSKSSSSSKDSKESVNDGYTNPYQALLSESKTKLSSEVVFEQEDREEQQRRYSKLENNGISEKKENTNDNPEKVIYLELEDINTAEIMPVMESENGDTKEDNTKHHVEWTFKRLNTM